MADDPIVVVGAGIVGVSTALWLQRAGARVVLLDRGAPGQGASFGNAGLLAGWAVAPVTGPSLWREAPGMLLDRNGPLFLRWRHLPGMLPWLARFLARATDRAARETVAAMAPLLTDTVEQHKALVRGTPMEAWVHESRFGFAYRDRRAFAADRYSWEMKALAGIVPQVLTGAAVRAVEPMLGEAVQCLAVIEGQGHVSDPGGYVAGLARVFQAEGGQIVQAEVRDFAMQDGRVVRVLTDGAEIACDRVVLTAGIWSKDLLARLGLRVPMEAERGYHILFKDPSQVPRMPMMVVDGKFGVNAMDMGLRCAGTVELGGHVAGPSKAPLAMIEHHVRRVFPTLEWSGVETWMGFRPTPADSTPLIGEIGETGIFAGFGHQHVGLTSGAKTGRLLAQMMTGAPPNIDMAPYAPARYLSA